MLAPVGLGHPLHRSFMMFFAAELIFDFATFGVMLGAARSRPRFELGGSSNRSRRKRW
jgi:hypothetical protein